MEISEIVEKVTSELGEAPEAIKAFISDPAGKIEELTGHKLEGDELKQVISSVKDKLVAGGGDIAAMFSGLADKVDVGAIADKIGDVKEDVTKEGGALSGIGSAISGLFHKAEEALTGHGEKAAESAEGAADAVADAASDAADSVSDALSGATDAAADVTNDAVSAVENAAEQAVDAVENAACDAASAAQGAVSDAADALKDAAQQ